MKVGITKDEWWPVYVPEEDYDDYEIPDDLYARYKATLAAFNAVQRELSEIYKQRYG